MNTTLTEHTTDEIEELRKDYYEEYYPSPRIEKAIFNYLDQDYYASEDDVFYTIYKKENDWFVNREDLQKEIEKMFGLDLPERIKVGPGEDDYIEPARNPIPGRVIHKWIVKHQLGLKPDDIDKGIDDIAEDLEYWGVDGDEMGPLKEHTNNKLTNKFINEFWPQYRSQLYSQLYNTYHPSAYSESFNRPSGNFEDALEIVADAVHDGKKLGLLDSSVDWSDIVHYDDDDYSTSDLRVSDDNGVPTLNNQLEILDNTNLDWIHGILLFDVLEDIVDEFKSYCGENGIDESGMGKCMDEFPPDNTTTSDSVESFAGTLKQDYYTLYNFMRELERAGIPVTEYMRSPLFPKIIKLVDDGTTDYDDAGSERTSADWDNTRTQIEFEMDAPDRLEEEDDIENSVENKELEIDRLEIELDVDKEELKRSEDELVKLDATIAATAAEKEKDKKKKGVIGIGKDASAFKQGKYFTKGKPTYKGDIALNMMYEQEEEETNKKGNDFFTREPDLTKPEETSSLEKDIKKTNIEIQKAEIKRKEDLIRSLKNKVNQQTSTGVMGGDDDKNQLMGGDDTEDGEDVIKISKIIEPNKPLAEHDDEEDGAERLYKQHAYDNEDYVDNSPFTRKEVIILKALHKNLSRSELQQLSQETPGDYAGGTGAKFWNIMKLFGIEHSRDEAKDTRVSKYAKWALDNWTEEGDYGDIENPVKVPLKWYDVDMSETGSQIEYKVGSAEVLGFDEDDASERAQDDFYSWGGEMETNDWGDYEAYDSEIDDINFMRMDEQINPELKYTIDQQYRTNPEMRDEILQSLEDEELGKHYLNPEGSYLNVPPIKIAQKFSDVNGYGKIKFDMQGGNGIAYFTDKGLVIKLTTDDSEYFTANKLVGTDNEYIVKVFESARIKTSHTKDYDLFVIVEEALPMTEEMEKVWSQCCCGTDSPIHIDYLEEPALVLPPVSEHDKCLPIYDNIIEIQKNFAEYGIFWSDIGIDNMGIKNGKLAVVDLGETSGEFIKGKEVTLNLENVKIRPLTSKQIKKQLVLI